MDTKDEGALYLMIGAMRADLAHILSAIQRTGSDIAHLETRLGEVEKFNWKIVGIASVLVPVLTISMPFVLRALGLL